MNIDTKELKTITVLYVEDDQSIRTQTAKVFEKILKKVYVACDGEEGLKIFLKHQNDIEIIVTDINMPNMNGLEMIEQINKYTTNIPFIITTAHTDSEHLLNAIELNVDKYIPKPVQIRDLTAIIVNLVLKYRRSNNIEALAKNLVQKSSQDVQTNHEMQTTLDFQKKQIEYYQTIIDNFVFTFQTDKTGNIFSASTKFIDFFGYDKENINNMNINDLKCESCEGENFQQLMLKAIHTKRTIASTHTFITNEGTKTVFDLTMTPNYGSDSLVNGYTFYLERV